MLRTLLVFVIAAAAGAGGALYWGHRYVPPAMTSIAPDGSRYYGPLVDGKRHGIGKVEWDSGTRYEGGFENGLYSGPGVFTTDTGNRWEAHFERGLMSGSGSVVYFDGSSYEGNFHLDKYNGKGRFKDRDGEIYEGDFVDDAFTGQGIHTMSDGSRIEGQFLKWVANGPGKYIDSNGNIYEGILSNGVLNGPGRYVGKDGGEYEGEFQQWAYNGSGKFKLPNGDVYTGEFKDGYFHGKGHIRYAKAKSDGRTEEQGVWAYGSLENQDRAQKHDASTERALYNQQSLLAEAIATLKPSDPNRVDLYFLGVAGDGTQEVFRREIEYVRTQFDRDYGTQGRSLALINSRSSVDRTPLATSTSIRTALDALAERMDKQNDILFLYLTSHGSKKYQFSLQQSGMDFPDLGAAELAAIMKASGIRHKLIVVSACYSGGFIDHLKSQHTMVITAARHDRTSFGCADENDFTYFGRAFFKEALPQSESFADAFTKAASLVHEWEQAQPADPADKENSSQNKHSLPQIHRTASIEAQLKLWRSDLKIEAVPKNR